MDRRVLHGLAAGALGTAALNVVTYLDMALRARPASRLPAEVVRVLTERAGVALSPEGPDSAAAGNRREGLGGALGYASGLSYGVAYGLARPLLTRLPAPAAGALLGLVVMAGNDLPAARMGVTHPGDWGASGWAGDVVPHLAYGWVTAAALDALEAQAGRRRPSRHAVARRVWLGRFLLTRAARKRRRRRARG